MNKYEEVIWAIVRDTEVLDQARLRHSKLGTLVAPDGIESLETDSSPLLSSLWRLIYLFYYAGDFERAELLMRGERQVLSLPEHENVEFVESLRKANPGRGPISTGWRLIGHDGLGVRITKDGLTLRVQQDQLL